MDFQRLFKRKEEGSAPPITGDNTRETLNERDVLICEGELLDGETRAPLVWSNVGGAIKVKADKILGILQGRTRIKAAILQDLYPALFEKVPNPGTEFNIPLQVVVMQLADMFSNLSSGESVPEDFNTPFGQLAREDEVKFKEKPADRPELQPIITAKLVMPPQLGTKLVLEEEGQSTGVEELTEKASTQELKAGPFGRRGNGLKELQSKDKSTSEESRAAPATFDKESGETCTSAETGRDAEICPIRAEPGPANEKLLPAFESPSAASRDSALSSGGRRIENNNIRRDGHGYLQELYLTDELLDGSKVADLILQLPRVTGVVIMLSDGAALGGSLSGGLNEALLSVTPDFVKHLSIFTKSMEEGPANFVTFSDHACRISLTIGGDVLILAGHRGKNLPPGLRERLVATAQALNMIYSS